MLSVMKHGAARFTWRGRALLLCVAAGALALPAVQWMRPSAAVADDSQPVGNKPALDPIGRPLVQETAKDTPASNPFGQDGEQKTAKDKPASDPFGPQPEQVITKDKRLADLEPALNLKPTLEASKPRAVAIEYLPQPSANEKKILAALESKTECDFTETPLADVAEYLSSRHDIQVRMDERALRDEAIDTSVPVTFRVKGVSLKSALRRILADHDLTFVIRDEVLLITTKTKADTWLSIRTYPVGDLVESGQKEAGYETLVKTITTTVDPTTWDEGGGPGNAKVVTNAKSIVISQSDAAHEKILDLLRSLRAAKAKQETAGTTAAATP